MIGIIIPAHNEAAQIGACVTAAKRAASHHQLLGEEVRVIVVADHCSDDTAAIAESLGADVLAVNARNVGIARGEGARRALSLGARWLAFTDADSVVADDWLVRQLDLCADAVCGVIAIHDWSPHLSAVREHFARTYTDADDHRHIHGANMGVSAAAYLRVGGFAPLEHSEDVALVEALIADGASIAWSAAPRVVTSARTDFRARKGFGATLVDVSRRYFLASSDEDGALAA
ncbi:MAG: glycosyltransferase [Pseudomonadota bacterium]|jgi:glycosyltransferase involved in cell wall biosynthesis|uniref:Glycosyl transferase, group 2 family protein n=2 Tax=Caballeronia TaxID=1827195 RepID=A0A242MZF7_CABSO|nr:MULTISPECIES: glycosyltransferase [Burkholderiaceae]AMM17986.1 glycosyl transferase [Burkholderia sp. PAMC 28687]MDP9154134.1 glycosyltransferase [Pseudomonadota bacterium]OTP76785.1 Glycosyl transferase, group 2 family protein [Caballeronia sordidicola]